MTKRTQQATRRGFLAAAATLPLAGCVTSVFGGPQWRPLDTKPLEGVDEVQISKHGKMVQVICAADLGRLRGVGLSIDGVDGAVPVEPGKTVTFRLPDDAPDVRVIGHSGETKLWSFDPRVND